MCVEMKGKANTQSACVTTYTTSERRDMAAVQHIKIVVNNRLREQKLRVQAPREALGGPETEERHIC